MNTEAGGYYSTSSFRPMAREEDLTDQQFDELCQQHAPICLPRRRRSESAAPVVQARTILKITYENGFPEFSYGSHNDIGAEDAEEGTDPDSDFRPMACEKYLTDQQFDELCQQHAPMCLPRRRRSERAAPVVQAGTILEIRFENGFPEFSDGSHNDIAVDDAEEETDPDSDTDTAAEEAVNRSDAEKDEDKAEESDTGERWRDRRIHDRRDGHRE